MNKSGIIIVVVGMFIAGCAVEQFQPTVPTMPAKGQSLDAFESQTAFCEQFAQSGMAALWKQHQNHMVAAMLFGAFAGAAVGQALGDNGQSAAIGAVYGAGIGTAAGSEQGYGGHGMQQIYNIRFAQCMYTKGAQVPGFMPLVIINKKEQ